MNPILRYGLMSLLSVAFLAQACEADPANRMSLDSDRSISGEPESIERSSAGSDTSQDCLKTINGAAYFKHFKGKHSWREVVVFYNKNGEPLRSVEVTGIKDILDLYDFFIHDFLDGCAQTNCHHQKREQSYLISLAKSDDLLAIEDLDKRKEPLPEDLRDLEGLNAHEASRFVFDVDHLAYCSGHDAATRKILAMLK